jgi:hypothetical protein
LLRSFAAAAPVVPRLLAGSDDGRAYFAATDPASGVGSELWQTDGTPAGTISYGLHLIHARDAAT